MVKALVINMEGFMRTFTYVRLLLAPQRLINAVSFPTNPCRLATISSLIFYHQIHEMTDPLTVEAENNQIRQAYRLKSCSR